MFRKGRWLPKLAGAALALGFFVAAWVGLGGPALADDAATNRLFVEAVQLVDEAGGIEAPLERAGAYEEALERLDAIVERYPESELAVKRASG